MKVYYDYKFRQWCADDSHDGIAHAAWGDTKEEAINNLHSIEEEQDCQSSM